MIHYIGNTYLMVTIIDYGMGNVGSVRNALETLGAEVVISNAPADIEHASHLILPGVGNFKDGMARLTDSGVLPSLTEAVLTRKTPFLGICLGMQMLAERGDESGGAEGLGWIPGVVQRLVVDERLYRMPHVGWNDVTAKANSILLAGVKRPIFYFVHSYQFVPKDNAVIAATCEYDEIFTAAIENGTIFGVQFHPEKSQKEGLHVLQNFLNVPNNV